MAKNIIRDKRDKGWFYLDNEYLNGYAKIFGAIGTAIYVSLCRHADNETQKCFPSYKKIGEELNLSEKTIKKYINAFKEYNLISVFQKKKENGQFESNTYTLLDKSVWKSKPKVIKVPTVKATNRGERVSVTVGNEIPNKDTHIKETHINTANKFAVNELIDLFKSVNPSFERLFKNKTQRLAIERMADKFGEDKLIKLIEILPKTNEMQYAPSITTPLQLEQKMGSLKVFLQKRNEEIKKNQPIII